MKHERVATPLAGHTVMLHSNDKRVRILGWLNKNNITQLKSRYKSMFDEFLDAHSDIDVDNDCNILVAVDMESQKETLVHISDIIGYVKTELSR